MLPMSGLHPGRDRLLTRMVRLTGIDLASAYTHSVLAPSEWDEMVTQCRRCDWTGGCAAWLNRGKRADVPPAPCRNRRRLTLLKLDQEMRK